MILNIFSNDKRHYNKRAPPSQPYSDTNVNVLSFF